ncbi:M23 family metallopeptidase [Methylomicrobium sp. Wu6]|uniref:murein hydrolase activator EnvC family protein n=1 Tax=Methylomicrobium sp. Wu6 TaxID=3107928 RepID=UPI002DD684F0|nr:M23 family metallopeptidase [Methylomicrobium sp. Wu6]MEC4750634.1 M23 family metallopeptidase [Methylomicrobium sp. Wu6]
MGNDFRNAVLMLIPALATVMFGCTERADLAPVRTGHQHINDAFSDMPSPPQMTSSQEMPPVPRDPYPRALNSMNRRPHLSATLPSTVRPVEKYEAKTKPKTIASNLTAKKSIMPEFEPAKSVRKIPATEITPSAKKANAKLSFGWPLAGSILKNYTQTGKKGIKISGKKGQTVRAAEAGKVVYSGQGLIGYGNLLIIKHNGQYLTAYANNSALLAKEGDVVEKGQEIATVGAGTSHKGMLHFEIRKQGKSVNPLTLLPKL